MLMNSLWNCFHNFKNANLTSDSFWTEKTFEKWEKPLKNAPDITKNSGVKELLISFSLAFETDGNSMNKEDSFRVVQNTEKTPADLDNKETLKINVKKRTKHFSPEKNIFCFVNHGDVDTKSDLSKS